MCSFGESKDFPAFYTARSGHKAPYNVADASHAARVLQAARQLQLTSGIVIGVPVPKEHTMDGEYLNYFLKNNILNFIH